MDAFFYRSDEWGLMKAHIEERLAWLRAQNDAPSSPELTALLRGRIAELKHFLVAEKTVMERGKELLPTAE